MADKDFLRTDKDLLPIGKDPSPDKVPEFQRMTTETPAQKSSRSGKSMGCKEGGACSVRATTVLMTPRVNTRIPASLKMPANTQVAWSPEEEAGIGLIYARSEHRQMLIQTGLLLLLPKANHPEAELPEAVGDEREVRGVEGQRRLAVSTTQMLLSK